MVRLGRRTGKSERRGAAVVELAILLPLLAFLFVISVDYARLFYFSVTVTNAARNGALWACDSTGAMQSPYKTLYDAAVADAGNLSPAPTVTSAYGTDSGGNNYVEVTVSWTFKTITQYPVVPSTVNLAKTIRMRIIPATPTSF